MTCLSNCNFGFVNLKVISHSKVLQSMLFCALGGGGGGWLFVSNVLFAVILWHHG